MSWNGWPNTPRRNVAGQRFPSGDSARARTETPRTPRRSRSGTRWRHRTRRPGRARAGGEARRRDAGRRHRRDRRSRTRAPPRSDSPRRCPLATLFSPKDSTAAPSRATSAVRSVEPSSTTSTSVPGSATRSSASTAGRLSSSFSAGMKTMVPGMAFRSRCARAGARCSKRSAARGVTSRNGSLPRTRSRTISPTAGACMKPWPEAQLHRGTARGVALLPRVHCGPA